MPAGAALIEGIRMAGDEVAATVGIGRLSCVRGDALLLCRSQRLCLACIIASEPDLESCKADSICV